MIEKTESEILPKEEPNGSTASEEKKADSDENTNAEAGQDLERAVEQLQVLKKQHVFDPNLPEDTLGELDEALQTEDEKTKQAIAHELLDNSPYPEVRAAVSNVDEGGDCNTIRAWTIGIVMSTIFSSLNALFSMRAPYIVITSYVAQVLAFPIGVMWAKFLPTGRMSLFGRDISLNPGPFTKKEHTVIVIMANATFGSGAAYATDIVLAQRAFYKQRFGWVFELLLCVTNNMIGFGLAGLFARFLVQPAATIWPATLINTTMFSALHDHPIPDPSKTSGWRMGKFKFFWITVLGSFLWYWMPGYIFPALSAFAFVTFIKPNNVIINQLFGGWSGLSLIPITFDWTQISGFNFSPMIAPWHAMANSLLGMVIFFWITTIGIHFSGAFYSDYLPISDGNSYDNTGKKYNVSRIINRETQEFDEAGYKAYSPLFLSTTFMLTYGLSFAAIISVVTHAYLYHGSEIWFRFKNFNKVEEDVHARLIAKYKPVPLWWYVAVMVGMTAAALGITNGYDTHLPWWAFLFSLLIAALWVLPTGLIYSFTNIAIGLNVLTEFIIGYMLPGRPMAMMLFKAYGYMTQYQALAFCQDMKLGMYMKVPPRLTFTAQMLATAWCSMVQIATINWALGSISDVCTQNQKNHFSCPGGRVFFNASVIWGAIGPARIFSVGQIYSKMMFFFIPGALLPFVLYYLAKKFPRTPIKYMNAPIIFGGAGLIPPATPLNYISWAVVGFIFNKLIKRRFHGWWSFYNYIFSAGLDIGLAFCTILIFLALQLNDKEFPSWWGSAKALDTLDYKYQAIRKHVADGERFGPKSW